MSNWVKWLCFHHPAERCSGPAARLLAGAKLYDYLTLKIYSIRLETGKNELKHCFNSLSCLLLSLIDFMKVQFSWIRNQ